MEDRVEKILDSLSKSKFRSSFHLRKYMIDYIDNKGYIEIKKIRYSNGKIWYSSKPKEYKLEWM